MLNKESKLFVLAMMLGVGCLPGKLAAGSSDPVVTPEMQILGNQYDVGRQLVETEGNALVVRANTLLTEKKFEQARDCYIQAQKKFEQFSTSAFRERVAYCQRMIKQSYIEKAREAMRIADERVQVKDFEEAIKLCEEAIKYCPEERDSLQAKIAFYQKRQNAATMRDDTSRSKLMPNYSREQYDIQILQQQGRELANAGEYTKALRKFQEVLLIDPYNSDTLQSILAINTLIGRVGKERFANTLRKMVSEVNWKFAIPITPDSDGEVGTDLLTGGPVANIEKEESALQKKLNSIIIPKFEVDDSSLTAAIKSLRDLSRLNDPEKLGVNILLRTASTPSASTDGVGANPGGEPNAGGNPNEAGADAQVAAGDAEGEAGAIDEQLITLYINNRSVMDVIANLCRVANMRYRVEQYAVVLAPQNVALDDMETRIFPVEQGALSSINGGGEDREALKTFFIERGVPFPIGSKIVYDTRISRLIVTNTVENLRTIGNVISESLDQQEPMVQVMVKFIEISQTDLKELAFNYQLAINNRSDLSPEGHTVKMGPSSNELLRYYRTDGGGQATASNPVTDSTFSYVWENSDGTKVSGSMFALNWADSGDVLASPRVTTGNGQLAHIEMVTERYFPEEWTTVDMKVSDTNSSGDSNDTSSSWRTTRADPQPQFEGEARKLGIIFDITPEIDRDRRTITAVINFPIQTFSGWMVFDARAQSEDGESGDDDEYFKMPIFDRREINTKITVYDGDTVVLGGVASDKSTVVYDKIPVLGDLPFIGRLFQSRYTSAEKRNLLVFLTCKLVKPDGTPFFPQEERNRGVPKFGQNYF
ncbi:MAG: hypothetical protein LBM70_07695 [Victivallales bacterium]|jgi:general secretion pathway protein D|nr:hypothetical protein [Victivallales bacterium]